MENNNVLDIYSSLQKLRNDPRLKGLKKTGKNAHLNFQYYELDDFLPVATTLFSEYGICPIFRIEVEPNGIEYAYLTLIKDNEQIIFKVPTADPTGNNPIQQLGSKITYLRRYLYITCLDLTEQDSVDGNIENNKKVDFATAGQVSVIQTNGKLIADELKALNVKTVNDIKALTKDKAKELCDLIEERKNAKEKD